MPASILRATITGATTIDGTYKGKLVYVSAAAGDYTISFVPAATLGDGFWCALQNTQASGSATVVTLDPDGTETIDGASTRRSFPGERIVVYSDGSNLTTVEDTDNLQTATARGGTTDQAISITNSTTSTSTTTGALVVTGGVGIGGACRATSFAGNGSNITSLSGTNISTGTVSAARLGAGTTSSATFLRGDSQWATVPVTSVAGRTGAITLAAADVSGVQATITGGASTITSNNLLVSRVLVSDASGKVDASSVTATTLGYLDATSSIQTQLNGKQSTITGGATTITSSDLTISRALVSSGSGKVAVSTATSTEVGYLSGLTGSIQTQLDGKQATLVLTGSRALATNSGGAVTASTATSTELGYLSGVTSAIQTQLNARQATITGGATTITSSNLTASRALASDASGKVAVSSVSSTELSYLSGVTSGIQNQFSAKQNTITGGASTITTANLTANRALASNSTGKVVESDVTDTELRYLIGVTSLIQPQLNAKAAVTVKRATTANLNATYTAGTSPTLTNAGTLATLSIEGFVNAGDLILVKNQDNAAHNGIYTVTTEGSESVAWVLTRFTLSDTVAEIPERIVVVSAGVLNRGKVFTTRFDASTAIMGTTEIPWYELVQAAEPLTTGAIPTSDSHGKLVTSAATATIPSSTASTSTTTGALVVTGGVGVGGAIYGGSHVSVAGDLIMSTTSDVAIGAADTYGWKDITAEVTVRGSGANNPSWATFRNGLSAYSFSASTMQECWLAFHVNHDYAPGTDIYLHIHWAPNTTSTGTVRWGFEYSIAKGHQQATGSYFAASTTVYVEPNIATNKQYVHHVSETAAISSTNLEPDALILVRVFRDAGNANDTFPDVVFAFTADVHYQASRFATKNKAPNFYT